MVKQRDILLLFEIEDAEQCVCSRLREGRGIKLGGVTSSLGGRALLSRLKRRVRCFYEKMYIAFEQAFIFHVVEVNNDFYLRY